MAIPNVNQITSTLRNMPDQQLQQYAAMHKADPYVLSLAVAESNSRKQLRAAQQAKMAGQQQPTVADQNVAQMAQLPEEQGIGALPAPNLQGMADGGIVGYNPYYSTGGTAAEDTDNGINMAEGGIAHFRDGGLNDYIPQIVAEAKRLGIDPQVAINLFKTESGGNKNAMSSKGAAGLGQLMKPAAQEMGLSEEERFDPQKNISASLGYFKKQLDRFGSYDKAAAAYNWGPGNVKNHLKKNEGILDRLSLPKETANYLTKLMPGRDANAGEVDARFAAAAKGESGAPKAAPQAQATPQTAEPRAITGNQGLIGAGETALQYATGLAAIPTAGGAAVLGQLPNIFSGKGMDRAEMEKSFREKAGQVTYEPRTEGGRAVSEGFAKTLEDLKIPPYLAHMGNLSPTRGRAGIPAAELEALAAEKTRMAETPRLTGPGVSETMVQGKGKAPIRNAEAVAKQLADIDEAKAWRDTVLEGKATQGVESTRPEVIARNAELARAQGIAAAASPAATAGTYVQPGQEGISALNVGSDYGEADDRSFGPIDRSGTTPDKDLAAATDKNKEAKGKFTDDDLLMLGLGMMANNKPGTGRALGDLLASAGTAGIGALQNKKEREKLEMDKEYKDILGKYYGSLGKKAEGEAALYASGEKFRMADRQKAAAAIEQEMAKWQQTAGMAAPPGAEARKRQELTNYYFNLFGLDVPDTIGAQATGSNFKVLGSRPS